MSEQSLTAPTQLFPSWVQDAGTLQWSAPVPMPQDGKCYYWSEPTVSWVNPEDLSGGSNV